MQAEGIRDVASLGRRLRLRVLCALCLSSALPLLMLGYVVLLGMLSDVDAVSATHRFGLRVLLPLTLLAALGGGWLVWDLGTLVRSFAAMRATIEQQAVEANTFAAQLDAAYRELELTSAKLKETSFRDEVTGLYNRRFFSLRLEEEMSRFRRFNHPVSVVLLDIDGFKSVNDDFGHVVGDATLRDIGQILMKHSRGINVVSRFGGDEFAVLLVETSKAGARLYADRIRQVVATFPFSHGKVVTASFGVASLPDDEVTTSEDLFRAADEALYAAKRAGKNRVVAAGAAPPMEG